MKNEMSAASGMYGAGERCMLGFDRETWGNETTWKARIMLKWDFKKRDGGEGGARTGLILLRMQKNTGLLERGNEP